MESLEDKIKRFLSVGYGSGDGSGDGSGYGDGYGYGSGDGSGSGDGYGYGSGDGSGDGYGDGSGDGSGYGYGDGSGYGYGYGELKSYNHRKVYYIDAVPTLVDSVRGNVARGFMINRDKTLSACYVVKVGNCFAHGETLKAAHADALAKYMQDMSEEERIAEFIKDHPTLDAEYPCKDLFKWHNILTGSCEMGRRQFCQEHAIDLESDYTVRFFLDITKDAYGGNVIKKVIAEYESMGE